MPISELLPCSWAAAAACPLAPAERRWHWQAAQAPNFLLVSAYHFAWPDMVRGKLRKQQAAGAMPQPRGGAGPSGSGPGSTACGLCRLEIDCQGEEHIVGEHRGVWWSSTAELRPQGGQQRACSSARSQGREGSLGAALDGPPERQAAARHRCRRRLHLTRRRPSTCCITDHSVAHLRAAPRLQPSAPRAGGAPSTSTACASTCSARWQQRCSCGVPASQRAKGDRAGPCARAGRRQDATGTRAVVRSHPQLLALRPPAVPSLRLL